MKRFWELYQKYRIVIFLVLLVVLMILVAIETRNNREEIVYADSLDEIVATVRGEEISLRDFALYVAHQEAEVQEQAVVYNPENTRAYWNIHTDGTYISHAARNEAMSMAIHDELFYQLSQELEIVLTTEESKLIENDADDFWADLIEEEKHLRLGITRDDVYNTMCKIACAEKAQSIYAAMAGVDYEDMDFYEEEFLKFLEKYEYKVDDSVLSRLDFGDITLVH